MAAAVPAWRKVLRFWEIPFLAALAGLMFWVRMLPYQALVGSGRAYYIGTDPFYHYRETLGIVRSFPRVPRFDPWTFYPHGTPTGQFGSLFDWVVAAYVVATEGKGASEEYVAHVLGVFPAVLGALLIVPFYFLAKRLLGTAGAIVASLTLAVLPGEFLIRSIAGYSDHHVAEALMCLVSILGVYVAVEKGHASRGALRDLRAVEGYWKPLAFGILGGVALAANFLAWPPALLFLAILAVWLTVAILVENAQGGDARGMAFGGAVAFATAGVLMMPVMETTFLGEFNTYGILHVVMSLGAALWVVAIHAVSRLARERGVPAWGMPAALTGLALAGFLALRAFAPAVHGAFLWGLSWITGIGVRRTTTTIAEARQADFFCARDSSAASCLATDFGLVAPVTFLILLALLVWAVAKRRRADSLLAIWSLVIFLATATQIRFSYYLALNMALLVGWLAARVAESTGLEGEEAEAAAPVAVKGVKGRKTKRAAETATRSRPLQVAAVAAVLLLVLPGNVFATDTSIPGWKAARITAPDSDLVTWMQGLDWMRENTPDAGVDLGLVVPRPRGAETFDYPPEAYGVLSWWDYGHWIETIAKRPPVANPFQQAAPFASTWFTERDPAQAERLLDDWVGDENPVRYVWIDDAMATGKYGAITVWANSQNASRDRWADGDYIVRESYDQDGEARQLPTVGPQYRESMMGRLFDDDGAGLHHYRLVWEHPQYAALGHVLNSQGQIRCFHDIIPSSSCPVGITGEQVLDYRPGSIVQLGDNAHAYDLEVVSSLKLFERVEGARLVGEARPGAAVVASVDLVVQQEGAARSFRYDARAVADESGRFELVFPYATSGFLTPEEGGTNTIVKPRGAVRVESGGLRAEVDVPDAAVLQGQSVPVSFP